MKNKLMKCAVLTLLLAGCNGNDNGNDNKNDVSTIVERHKITEIKNGYVHGEKVNGSGEGIYYSLNEFEQLGIDDINIGDVVEIVWTEDDFINENWDNVHSLELMDDNGL